eukprot:15105801-Heterocapsa_arctica.AAC.1
MLSLPCFVLPSLGGLHLTCFTDPMGFTLTKPIPKLESRGEDYCVAYLQSPISKAVFRRLWDDVVDFAPPPLLLDV